MFLQTFHSIVVDKSLYEKNIFDPPPKDIGKQFGSTLHNEKKFCLSYVPHILNVQKKSILSRTNYTSDKM